MSTDWQALMEHARKSLVLPSKRSEALVNVGPTERAVSATAGALLVGYGIKRRDGWGVLSAVGGLALLHRGVTGYCIINDVAGRDSATPAERAQAVDITRAITIERPRAEVYQTWRNLELLPRFMHHLAEVKDLGDNRSRWRARLPSQALGLPVEWEAEITEDEENRRIGWRSLPDARIHNSGAVRFSDSQHGNATHVHVHLLYEPPGAVGERTARLLNPALGRLIEDDLRRFKEMMESGELAVEPRQADQATAEGPEQTDGPDLAEHKPFLDGPHRAGGPEAEAPDDAAEDADQEDNETGGHRTYPEAR